MGVPLPHITSVPRHQTAVFSGDTRRCPALISAARGAGLLVREMFIHREFTPVPGRSKDTIANVASYHTAAHEVGEVAAEAGVRCLVLTLFVPSRFDRDALLEEVRTDFSGPLLIGEDLMRIDLTTGTVRHAGAVMSFGQGWFGKS